jgi:hypothetical protein
MLDPGGPGEYVTYQRAAITGRSARGNDIITFTDSTVGPVAWEPGTEAEAAIGTEQVTAGGQMYLPRGTPVAPQDRIIRENGETFEITGEGGTWTSPFTGLVGPVFVHLKRVTGATAHMSTEAG